MLINLSMSTYDYSVMYIIYEIESLFYFIKYIYNELDKT